MSTAKARTLNAKYHAITNASEMIRSHGEEGFAFIDKKFDKVYKRETKKLSDKLNKMSEKYLIELEKLGIDINVDIKHDYF